MGDGSRGLGRLAPSVTLMVVCSKMTHQRYRRQPASNAMESIGSPASSSQGRRIHQWKSEKKAHTNNKKCATNSFPPIPRGGEAEKDCSKNTFDTDWFPCFSRKRPDTQMTPQKVTQPCRRWSYRNLHTIITTENTPSLIRCAKLTAHSRAVSIFNRPVMTHAHDCPPAR